MTDYVVTVTGSRSRDLSADQFKTVIKSLTLLRDEFRYNFDPAMQVELTDESIRLINEITGCDFEDWLESNHRDGIGLNSLLCSRIVDYLNGRVGVTSLRSVIGSTESRLPTTANPAFRISVYDKANRIPLKKSSSDKLNNFSFYQLLGGIGLYDMIRIFLIVGGNDYVSQ